MQAIRALMRKEFAQVFRTKEMLALIFGIPLIQMTVLGFTITNEVKHISLIIADRDNSVISRQIGQAFTQTDRFDFLGFESDFDKIMERVHDWDAQMALVIPPNFARDIRRGRKPAIQVVVDGLDGNTAGIALGYAQGILTRQAGEIAIGLLRKNPVTPQPQINPLFRLWYNMNLDSAQFMVPGIVVVLLTIISMMLSAMSLVKEKEIGTLEQLMVTPLHKYQLLLGKILPFLLLAFFELGLVMFAAQWIFNIHMHGSYVLLFVLAFFYLFTTLGLGIFVSTITGTQQQAMFVSWFFMLFLLLLSGLFIPIENMPQAVKILTYLNPMRYFMYIMRDIFQKGAGFTQLLVDIIPMTVYGVLIFTVSVLKFRKRVA